MSLRCILGHRRVVVAAQTYVDTSWNDRVRSTHVVSRCDRCGRVFKTHLYGVVLTLAELTAR